MPLYEDCWNDFNQLPDMACNLEYWVTTLTLCMLNYFRLLFCLKKYFFSPNIYWNRIWGSNLLYLRSVPTLFWGLISIQTDGKCYQQWSKPAASVLRVKNYSCSFKSGERFRNIMVLLFKMQWTECSNKSLR